MPDEVVEHLAERVARVPDHLVRAEEVVERAARREKSDRAEHDQRCEDAVEAAVARDRITSPALLEDREHERREQDRRDERERLHTCCERQPEEHDEQRHPPPTRPLEHEDESERDEQEERVEQVLRHDRPRVGE